MKATGVWLFVVLMMVCFLELIPPALGRPVRGWTDEQLAAEADLIVVGTAVSSGMEELDRKGLKADSWVGVNTVFSPQVVFKGKVEGKTFTVLTDRYWDEKKEIEVVDGPAFVHFDAGGGTVYLLYLKKLPDGKYGPVSGRMDPGFSVRIVKPYSAPVAADGKKDAVGR